MNKEQLCQLLDDKIDSLIDWVASQPAGTFGVQQVPGKWSNGEHVEHLRKSTRAVNKGFAMPKLLLRYKFGKMNRAERSYDEMVTKYKNKLKETGVKAPKAFTPEDICNTDKERILKWFLQEKETMKEKVKWSSEKQLTKYVLPHPLIGKLSMREFVCFTALHAEHHLDLMKQYNGR